MANRLMKTEGPAVYDYACFGIDAANKLSDDRYMIFYNQPSSPNQEIVWHEGEAENVFDIELTCLPSTINKLVFTVSIDGSETMKNILFHSFLIKQNGVSIVRLYLRGSDFKEEKAIITVELYRRDGWNFKAVASGFNGGLGDLLRSYGGTQAD